MRENEKYRFAEKSINHIGIKSFESGQVRVEKWLRHAKSGASEICTAFA